MARRAAEAVPTGRAGDRRRGAGRRPARLPLGALEPGLRRAAGQAQAGLPVRQERRALAAVLVDPVQPDQRAPGRAPEADAELERAARHRRGGPRGLWPSRGRAEGGAGRLPGRDGPDDGQLHGGAGGGAGGGIPPAALLDGPRQPGVSPARRGPDRAQRPAQPAAIVRRPGAARGDAGLPQRLPDGRGRPGRVVPGRAPQFRLHRGDRHRAADDRHLRQQARPGLPEGLPPGGPGLWASCCTTCG